MTKYTECMLCDWKYIFAGSLQLTDAYTYDGTTAWIAVGLELFCTNSHVMRRSICTFVDFSEGFKEL